MKPPRGKDTSQSCSCTSCFYKSESESPSIKDMLLHGTKIDKLYLGQFIPMREQKLLDKLIRTRGVYDDLRNQLLSDSNLSGDLVPTKRSPSKHRRKDVSDTSSAILQLVNLVGKGAVGQTSLSECCSCCSCDSIINLQKIASGVHRRRRSHTGSHRGMHAIDSMSRYGKHRKARGGSRTGMHRGREISKHHKKQADQRSGKYHSHKARHVRSDSCLCILKSIRRLSNISLKNSHRKQPKDFLDVSQAYKTKSGRKIRRAYHKMGTAMGEAGRKSAMKLKDAKTKIRSRVKKSIENVKKADSKVKGSINKSFKNVVQKVKDQYGGNDLETNMLVELYEDTFKLDLRDSLIKYKEDMQRKKILDKWACDFECDPEICEPAECFRKKKRSLRRKRDKTDDEYDSENHEIKSRKSDISTASDFVIRTKNNKVEATTDTQNKKITSRKVKNKIASVDQQGIRQISGKEKAGRHESIQFKMKGKNKRGRAAVKTKSVKSITILPSNQSNVAVQPFLKPSDQSPPLGAAGKRATPKQIKQQHVVNQPMPFTKSAAKRPVRPSTARRHISSTDKRHMEKKESSLPSPSGSGRQAVRVGSSFNFNIEFSKNKPIPKLAQGRKDKVRRKNQETMSTKKRIRHIPSSTSRSIGKDVQSGEYDLKRCFCTLKLKAKPARARKHRHQVNLQKTAQSKNRSLQTMKTQISVLPVHTLLPYECEPMICIPGECDPIECAEIIRQRNLKMHTVGTNSQYPNRRSHSTPNFTTRTVAIGKAYKKPQPNILKTFEKKNKYLHSEPVIRRPPKNLTPRRQAVRISSTFSFSIEFYRGDSINPNHQNNEMPSRPLQDVLKFEKKAKGDIKHQNKVMQPQKVRIAQKQSQKSYFSKSKQTATKHNLKRCFCTMKLAKKGKPHVQRFVQSTSTSGQSVPRIDKNLFYVDKGTGKQNINDHLGLKLLPFECEPGICVPGKCNPHECMEIINARNSSRGTTSTGTVNRMLKSTNSITNKPVKNLRPKETGKWNIKDQSKIKLLLYECEPGICVPGECNPYECKEIINARHANRGTKSTGTVNRVSKSTYSITNRPGKNFKTKEVQSVLMSPKKHNEPDHKIRKSRIPKYSPRNENSQAVKIGSSFRFDVDFFKEKSSPLIVASSRYVQKSRNLSYNLSPREKPKPPLKERGSQKQIDRRPQKLIQAQTEQKDKGVFINTALKRCFCTLNLKKKYKYKLPQQIYAARIEAIYSKVSMFKKGINTVNKIDSNECEPFFCTLGNCDTYQYLERSKSCEKFKSKDLDTATSKHKMISISNYNTSRNSIKNSYAQIQNNLNNVQILPRKKKQNRSAYTLNYNSKIAYYRAIKIGSALSFQTDMNKEQKISQQDSERKLLQKRFSTIKNKGERTIPVSVTGRESQYTQIEKLNKALGIRSILKKCLCTLKLQNNNNTPEITADINKSKIQTTVLPAQIFYSSTNIPKGQPGDISSSKFITIEKLSSVFSSTAYNNHMKNENSSCNVLSNSCSMINRSPYTNSFFAMNFQVQNLNKTRHKLEPFECEPGVCVPGECDPIVCQKRIMKRLMRKASTMTSLDKRSKSISSDAAYTNPGSMTKKIQFQEHAEKRKVTNERQGFKYTTQPRNHKQAVRVGSSFSFNIEFSKDRSANVNKCKVRKSCTASTNTALNEKHLRNTGTRGSSYGNKERESQSTSTMHDSGTGMGSKYKRCFCTLQLQKRGELQNVTHVNVDQITPMNVIKTTTKGQNTNKVGKYNNISNLLPYECEPYVCVPGECDPHKCLERIKMRERRTREFGTEVGPLTVSASTMTTINNKVSAGKYVQYNHRVRKSRPDKKTDITHRDISKNLAPPSRQAVRIGSCFSFDVKFYKDSTLHEENTTAITHYKQKTQVKPEKVQNNLNRTRVKSIQGSQSHRNKNFQVATHTKHESTKTSFLKRCFCTAKLYKPAGGFQIRKISNRDPKKIHSKHEKRHNKVQIIPNIKDEYNKDNRLKLKPYECEPGVCIPGKCDPYECEKMIKKRLRRDSGTSTQKNHVSSTTITDKNVKRIKNQDVQALTFKHKPQVKQCYEKITRCPTEDHNKHIVRIGSNFSFNMEFYKDNTRSPNNYNICSDDTCTKKIKKSKEYEDKNVPIYTPKVVHRPSQFHEKQMISKASGVGPLLKRCFCTLKLQKLGKVQHKYGTTTDPMKEYKDISVAAKDKARDRSKYDGMVFKEVGTKTHKLYPYLEPYECEPGTCVPGKCNPTECYKRIQQRNLRTFGTGTEKSDTRSVWSLTGKRIAQKKRVQTPRYKPPRETLVRNHTRQSKQIDFFVPESSGNRQYVRIGSTFNFDIEFFKNRSPGECRNGGPCANIKCVESVSRSIDNRMNNARMKSRGLYHKGSLTREQEQQVQTLKKDKCSNVMPMLKRCFCTLSIQNIQNKHTVNLTRKSSKESVNKPKKSNTQDKSSVAKLKYKKPRETPKYKLEPFECEPGVCIPGQCNPYQCLERIKRRGIHRKSRKVCTPRLCAQSRCTATDCNSPHTLSKDVQSKVPRIVEKPRFPLINPKNWQGVRIGSNISINLEFYKELVCPNNIQHSKHNTKCTDVDDKDVPIYNCKKGQCKNTNTQCKLYDCKIQAKQETDSKASATGQSLKRCFCTLKLHDQEKQIVTIGRVDNIQTMSPFKPCSCSEDPVLASKQAKYPSFVNMMQKKYSKEKEDMYATSDVLTVAEISGDGLTKNMSTIYDRNTGQETTLVLVGGTDVDCKVRKDAKHTDKGKMQRKSKKQTPTRPLRNIYKCDDICVYCKSIPKDTSSLKLRQDEKPYHIYDKKKKKKIVTEKNVATRVNEKYLDTTLSEQHSVKHMKVKKKKINENAVQFSRKKGSVGNYKADQKDCAQSKSLKRTHENGPSDIKNNTKNDAQLTDRSCCSKCLCTVKLTKNRPETAKSSTQTKRLGKQRGIIAHIDSMQSMPSYVSNKSLNKREIKASRKCIVSNDASNISLIKNVKCLPFVKHSLKINPKQDFNKKSDVLTIAEISGDSLCKSMSVSYDRNTEKETTILFVGGTDVDCKVRKESKYKDAGNTLKKSGKQKAEVQTVYKCYNICPYCKSIPRKLSSLEPELNTTLNNRYDEKDEVVKMAGKKEAKSCNNNKYFDNNYSRQDNIKLKSKHTCFNTCIYKEDENELVKNNELKSKLDDPEKGKHVKRRSIFSIFSKRAIQQNNTQTKKQIKCGETKDDNENNKLGIKTGQHSQKGIKKKIESLLRHQNECLCTDPNVEIINDVKQYKLQKSNPLTVAKISGDYLSKNVSVIYDKDTGKETTVLFVGGTDVDCKIRHEGVNKNAGNMQARHKKQQNDAQTIYKCHNICPYCKSIVKEFTSVGQVRKSKKPDGNNVATHINENYCKTSISQPRNKPKNEKKYSFKNTCFNYSCFNNNALQASAKQRANINGVCEISETDRTLNDSGKSQFDKRRSFFSLFSKRQIKKRKTKFTLTDNQTKTNKKTNTKSNYDCQKIKTDIAKLRKLNNNNIADKNKPCELSDLSVAEISGDYLTKNMSVVYDRNTGKEITVFYVSGTDVEYKISQEKKCKPRIEQQQNTVKSKKLKSSKNDICELDFNFRKPNKTKLQKCKSNEDSNKGQEDMKTILPYAPRKFNKNKSKTFIQHKLDHYCCSNCLCTKELNPKTECAVQKKTLLKRLLCICFPMLNNEKNGNNRHIIKLEDKAPVENLLPLHKDGLKRSKSERCRQILTSKKNVRVTKTQANIENTCPCHPKKRPKKCPRAESDNTCKKQNNLIERKLKCEGEEFSATSQNKTVTFALQEDCCKVNKRNKNDVAKVKQNETLVKPTSEKFDSKRIRCLSKRSHKEQGPYEVFKKPNEYSLVMITGRALQKDIRPPKTCKDSTVLTVSGIDINCEVNGKVLVGPKTRLRQCDITCMSPYSDDEICALDKLMDKKAYDRALSLKKTPCELLKEEEQMKKCAVKLEKKRPHKKTCCCLRCRMQLTNNGDVPDQKCIPKKIQKLSQLLNEAPMKIQKLSELLKVDKESEKHDKIEPHHVKCPCLSFNIDRLRYEVEDKSMKDDKYELTKDDKAKTKRGIDKLTKKGKDTLKKKGKDKLTTKDTDKSRKDGKDELTNKNKQSDKKNVESKKKIKPCVCGTKICSEESKRVKRDAKRKKMKKPCICGSKTCKRLSQQTKKENICLCGKKNKNCLCGIYLSKMNAKKRAKILKELEKRRAVYRAQDEIRHKKRLKKDRELLRLASKYKNSSDCYLFTESLLDVGKLGFYTLADIARSVSRAIFDPRNTYEHTKTLITNPKKAFQMCKKAIAYSRVGGACKRLRLRFKSMKCAKETKKRLESYAVTNYVMHVADDDPKKRLKPKKRKKGPRKREPLDFQCSLYMASLRRRPCLVIYYLCPWFYPHCVNMLNIWRQFTDMILFLLAVLVWSPCLLAIELCRALMCCTLCTA